MGLVRNSCTFRLATKLKANYVAGSRDSLLCLHTYVKRFQRNARKKNLSTRTANRARYTAVVYRLSPASTEINLIDWFAHI